MMSVNCPALFECEFSLVTISVHCPVLDCHYILLLSARQAQKQKKTIVMPYLKTAGFQNLRVMPAFLVVKGTTLVFEM